MPGEERGRDGREERTGKELAGIIWRRNREGKEGMDKRKREGEGERENTTAPGERQRKEGSGGM